MTVTWYVVRASGLVAFALLTASIALGLLMTGGARSTRWPRFALEDVHGFAGVVGGGFIALHGLALLVDSYLPFTLFQLVVPGTSPYRPLATAAGIIAAELLAALALTNRLRRQIPHRLWRRAHYLNFGVWLLALAHGLTAGGDTGTAWAEVLYTFCAATVAGLTVWRVLGPAAPASTRLRDASPSS
jgi:sulfoxide reductase heme-binding subunit YedZ